MNNPTTIFTQLIQGDFSYLENTSIIKSDLRKTYPVEFQYKDKLVKGYYNNEDSFQVNISIANILSMNSDAWNEYSISRYQEDNRAEFFKSIHNKSKDFLSHFNITSEESNFNYKDYIHLIHYINPKEPNFLNDYTNNNLLSKGANQIDLDLSNAAGLRDIDKTIDLLKNGANPDFSYYEKDDEDETDTSIRTYLELDSDFFYPVRTPSNLNEILWTTQYGFNHLFRRYYGYASSVKLLILFNLLKKDG